MTLTRQEIEAAVDAFNAAQKYRPGSRKDGRSPARPYVPVVVRTDKRGIRRTDQIEGLAYATKEEAKEAAAEYLAKEREWTIERLGERRYRALREQYGLPRELEEASV